MHLKPERDLVRNHVMVIVALNYRYSGGESRADCDDSRLNPL